VGKTYQIEFDLVRNSGAVNGEVAGFDAPSQNTTGAYSETSPVVVSTASPDSGVIGTGTFDGSVQNISIRETTVITPWTCSGVPISSGTYPIV
jgi:hypothetical protein